MQALFFLCSKKELLLRGLCAAYHSDGPWEFECNSNYIRVVTL